MKVRFSLEVDIEGFEDYADLETAAREVLYSAPAFDSKEWIDELQYEGSPTPVEMPVIEVGALLWTPEDTVRVVRMYVNEDGVVQVRLQSETDQTDISVDYEDIKFRYEKDELERINSGNDAYHWRQ